MKIRDKMTNPALKKALIGIVIVLAFYVCTRALFYYVTSPKQVDSSNGRSVYDIVKLTDDFMDSHDIDISKGSQEYIDWLTMSLMGQLDKDVNEDLRNQEWYSDYETYATCYLTEAQTMPLNPVLEFLGYNIVVPHDIRDKTIEELESTLPLE